MFQLATRYLTLMQWVASDLRKPLNSEANWKKRLQFAREHKDWTLEQWKKVMWSNESRFTLFQSDGCIRVRREGNKVMHPSCLVFTVQACWGSVMIWGWFSWSDLGSVTLGAPKMRSADYLNTLNEQVFPSMDFSSLVAWEYCEMTMPRFIRLKLWKSGSGVAAAQLSRHQYKILVKNECSSGQK